MTLQPVSPGASSVAGAVSEAQRNRVLRNAYWLLALSMAPTVGRVWLADLRGVG